MVSDLDIAFMGEALKQAQMAAELKEVPVGAVVVVDSDIVGRGHNLKERSLDPTAHAEMIAIREASERLKNWRLTGATIYVTLEPCIMCMGALIQARVKRLVFATKDPKAGACGSLYNIAEDRRLNHQIEVEQGVLKERAEALLKGFFKELRKDHREDRP